MIKRITKRLKDGEFVNDYDFDNHDLIILKGKRGGGKSYPVGQYISKHLVDGKKFLYVRASKQELPTANGWCEGNLNIPLLMGGRVKVKIRRGFPAAGRITLSSPLNSVEIGRAVALVSSADIKSDDFKDVFAVVFEEYSRRNANVGYEKSYVFNFLELIETVFRNREKKVFLISNSLTQAPLLERAISGLCKPEELTKRKPLFKNPIEYRLYSSEKRSGESFRDYLDGEVYSADDIKIKDDEVYPVMITNGIVICKHKIVSNLYHVRHKAQSEEGISYTKYAFAGLLPLATNAAKCKVQGSAACVKKFYDNLDVIIEESIGICARLKYAPSKIVIKSK